MKRIVTAVITLVVLAGAALAGPPLICEPFAIGRDASLPWSAHKDSWDEVDAGYKSDNLAADTLKLLDSTQPMLTRMETLRRATVYSSRNAAAGLDLGNRLLARALEAEVRGQANSVALFDAGYFVESMRAISHITSGKPLADIDGYDLARRSLPGLRDKVTAEYALGLMKSETAWPNEHIRRAVAGAPEGSPLAQSILKQFRGQTFAEVKKKLAD